RDKLVTGVQTCALPICKVVPEYSDGWKCKLTLPSLLDGERLNVTRLTVLDPGGTSRTVRLTAEAYRELIAATNYKQRTRKITERSEERRVGKERRARRT